MLGLQDQGQDCTPELTLRLATREEEEVEQLSCWAYRIKDRTVLLSWPCSLQHEKSINNKDDLAPTRVEGRSYQYCVNKQVLMMERKEYQYQSERYWWQQQSINIKASDIDDVLLMMHKTEYQYQSERYWWRAVDDAQDRVSISKRAILMTKKRNESIRTRRTQY